MSWKWEELTSQDFAHAVKDVEGTCIIPIGVLEKHGNHLPLGTDGLSSAEVAERAAALEPTIIFPTYYWGQIQEAKQWPGAIALPHALLLELLEQVCAEIARNGMRKIILLNGHGGNNALLDLFAFTMLEKRRDFIPYIIRLSDYCDETLNSPEWQNMMQSKFDEHAGEGETSEMLACRPELVRMDAIGAPGEPLGRLAGLGALTPVWWYADFPNHYAGDATSATAEKGEFLLNGYSRKVASIIKAVKADHEAERLLDEYFTRSQH